MLKVKLSEIISPRREKAIPAEFSDLPFIGMEHVEAHTMRLLGTVPAGSMRSAANRFYPDDVLYGRLRPYLNKVYKPINTGLCSAEFIVLPKIDGIVPDFLKYLLNSDDFVTFASHLNAGDRPRVDFDQISSFEFFLPSYLAQQRIVAEIEKQFSRLDEAVVNLKRVKANLKRYKAAVLKAAVEGKLTEEWRRQHPDVEPADKLLERILAERRKSVGKGKYKVPAAPETANLPELPLGWVWASLPQIGELSRGKSKHRPRDDARLFGGPYPFIQTGEVRKSAGTIQEYIHTYSEFGLQQSRIWPAGTLCITIAANIAETGILTFAACFPDSVVGFLNEQYPVTTRYVEFFIRTAKENLERFAPATAQKNINLDVLQNVAVPFPPLAEQHQIVSEVESRLSIVAGAETQVDANLRRADRLRQSILKQAFSGQLVPQDPNDEPASVLLERIHHGVGAIHESPARAARKPKRAIHESPLRKPQHPAELKPAASADFACLDDITAAILARMQPGREYARADLADALGLTTGSWNAAIQELKRIGKVRQVGEKRGAKYVLNGKVPS